MIRLLFCDTKIKKKFIVRPIEVLCVGKIREKKTLHSIYEINLYDLV